MEDLQKKVQKLSVEKFFKQTEIDLRKTIPKPQADKMLEGYNEDLNNPKLMQILTSFEKFMNLLGTGMEDVLESEDYEKLRDSGFKKFLEQAN